MCSPKSETNIGKQSKHLQQSRNVCVYDLKRAVIRTFTHEAMCVCFGFPLKVRASLQSKMALHVDPPSTSQGCATFQIVWLLLHSRGNQSASTSCLIHRRHEHPNGALRGPPSESVLPQRSAEPFSPRTEVETFAVRTRNLRSPLPLLAPPGLR